jgi:sec-independent protein translocase protein TatA
MGEFSPWHLLIVLAALVLLFGANKLPQMARSVGQSMRIFKAETRALSGEQEPGTRPPAVAPPAPADSAQAAPPAPPSDKPPAG